MSEYSLVNPYISGQFSTSFNESSPLKAATAAWNMISSKLSNCVPSFAFTLQEESGKKLHHFMVNENVDDEGKVSFNIKKYKKVDETKVNDFMNKLAKIKTQSGGKKADDDDSSSSSESEILAKLRYKHMKKRANDSKLIGTYLWSWSYYPTLYDVTYYDYFFVPTYVAPYMPYMYIYW